MCAIDNLVSLVMGLVVGVARLTVERVWCLWLFVGTGQCARPPFSCVPRVVAGVWFVVCLLVHVWCCVMQRLVVVGCLWNVGAHYRLRVASW